MATRRVRWFPAIGRPLFFAMPPEAAHRVAMSLLALPAPWTRLGGTRTDASLETDLAGLRLRNPIGLAAGFDKACRRLETLGALGFGYVVGGTVTRAARAGNASPRIARSPRQHSMVNAMGLPNPGAEAVAATLRDRARGPAPRFVSIADEAIDDAISSFELLEPLVDGVEVNASCPNVSWGRDRDDEDTPARGRLRVSGTLAQAPVREAPALRDRHRTRGGDGPRRHRCRRGRRRPHLLEHPSGCRSPAGGRARRAVGTGALAAHAAHRGRGACRRRRRVSRSTHAAASSPGATSRPASTPVPRRCRCTRR